MNDFEKKRKVQSSSRLKKEQRFLMGMIRAILIHHSIHTNPNLEWFYFCCYLFLRT